MLVALEAAAAFEAENGLQASGDDQVAPVTLDVEFVFERGDGLNRVFFVQTEKRGRFLAYNVPAFVGEGAQVDLKRAVHGG
jgi:hypothetical protein